MKKGLIYSCLLSAALMAGCTKKFDEINTDPTQISGALVNPNALMSQGQIKFSNTGYDQLIFQSLWVQSLASTYTYYNIGDKYLIYGNYLTYENNPWNDSYQAVTLIDEMKNLISGKADYANLDNCGTILRMLMLERITDLYGDIPFSQEGQAKAGIFAPVFDTQQSIYSSMLTQLDAACSALDASKAIPTSDLFYGGDIAQWKKLGYSLMLRVAMRLVKVDAATAQKYAEKAYAGGTMTSISDNAKVNTDNTDNYGNSDAGALLTAGDFRELKWSNTLISYMQANSDPRISAVAEIASGTGLAANNKTVAGNNTASLQLGLPNGYDLLGGSTDVSHAPNYPGATPADPSVSTDSPAPLGKYSRPRYAVYDDLNRANFLLTYGETELLLAEAATRGWNTGTASTHYANALAADMSELAQFNTTPVAVVSSADIAAYVTAHPLSAANALQQINMEYFVETSTTFNFNEAWNNWKRSAYPAITPVKYTNQYTDGSIPRRVPYPTTLPSSNPTNYAAAVARLSGGDTFISRMYWDSK